MSDWIKWNGGECPVHPDTTIEVEYRDGNSEEDKAGSFDECWTNDSDPADIVAYRIISEPQLTGGKQSSGNYYRIEVARPVEEGRPAYSAECADIIEALNMTFNEGEAFKAIWRLAAARQGRGKLGNTPQYDADKAAYYGGRIAAQTRNQAKDE